MKYMLSSTVSCEHLLILCSFILDCREDSGFLWPSQQEHSKWYVTWVGNVIWRGRGRREEGGERGEGREGVSLGDGWLSGAVHLCTNGVEATNEDSTSLTTNLTIEARRSSTV